jgi:hypothetical protein
MLYLRWSPTFSLVITSPCFFVSEPPSRRSIAITWLVLLPARGTLASVAAAGAFFARLDFFFAGGCSGAPSGDCGVTGAAGADSGLAGMAASG